jgi:hypothetical protein
MRVSCCRRECTVRVKRWGKSPPRPEQSGRHGKPRVVQGQIGGESRPGSLGPSGRLLESRCESGPRGMITAERELAAYAPNRIRLTGLPAINYLESTVH